MPLSEQQLINWSRPASTSEDFKCQNAVSRVTESIRAAFGTSVSIFLQGSYQNNTNVKQDSDVDIVVRHNEYFFPNLLWLTDEQRTSYHAAHPDSVYTFAQFKNEVQAVLQSTFGNVQRKNKCILVPENTYRVKADVVPCFVMKRFTTETNIDANGIKFREDDGTAIDSYPEQHYTKGVAKNNETKRMYKRTVRILKRIRNELIDSHQITESLVSSFFIECLVYNVPNGNFISGNYLTSLRNVITKIHTDMGSPETANNYEEVSGLKWLFRGGGRTAADARLFMVKCWEYGGF